MSVIDEYWMSVSSRANADFQGMRASQRDSSIKGTGNEEIVREFLTKNTGARRVATKSSIIDPSGRRSDEVDVVVLNDGQPFWTRETSQLLIAEGVDAVYQVKARLDSRELKRAVRNAESVKQLTRVLPRGSMASAVNDEDGSRFVDRIPFFIFAFSASIGAATALATLREASQHEVTAQADGVFVLDKWSIINFGSNQGVLRIGPPGASGFQEVKAPQSNALAEMLWCHHISGSPGIDVGRRGACGRGSA